MSSNGTFPRHAFYRRYYCTTCNHRVFPYDTFEVLTEAPKLGKSGKQVLLFSHHGSRDQNDGNRWVYCDHCHQWREARKKTYGEVLTEYCERNGVVMRVGSQSQRSKLNALDEALERRRMLAKT